MPAQVGIPVKRDFWRINLEAKHVRPAEESRLGEQSVLDDFRRLELCALPLIVEGLFPGDFPREDIYHTKHDMPSFGQDQWEAFWNIKTGDRVILTVAGGGIVAKGTAKTRCRQNKNSSPLDQTSKYKICFKVKWDDQTNIAAKLQKRYIQRLTDNDEQLKLCQELETKKMTRPYVEATNLILCGPPGTGKTFQTKRTACEICFPPDVLTSALEKVKKSDRKKVYSEKFKQLTQGAAPQVEFITFHPNYDYSDFIEGFRPNDEGKEGFVKQDGVLMRLAKRAIENKDKNYLLIIDEINRGNIAKIFGETITLLEEDKRIGGDFELQCRLPTSRDTFGLPENLYIRGTMNTADRSIAMLDIALRRRFDFEEVPPNPDLLENASIKLTEGTIKQAELMRNLNKMLLKKEILGNRDYQIGHAWFSMVEEGEKKPDDAALGAKLVSKFRKKIIPLLQEWMYETPERLWGTSDDEGKSLLGGIMKQDDPSSITLENILKLQLHLKDALDKIK